MSFSLSIPNGPVDNLAETIDQAIVELPCELTDATRETLNAAKDAAVALAASGVVGQGTVSGSLSGHANPGHVPTDGWANDCVTISLSCTTAREPAPE